MKLCLVRDVPAKRSLYASRYGGNDPDVWRTGKCDACDGSGNEVCSSRGCDEPAVAFNDDGDALCADCLMDWDARLCGGQRAMTAF